MQSVETQSVVKHFRTGYARGYVAGGVVVGCVFGSIDADEDLREHSQDFNRWVKKHGIRL